MADLVQAVEMRLLRAVKDRPRNSDIRNELDGHL